MGRIRETIAYLECDPDKLIELKKELYHITITEELKKKRKELKLYLKDRKED